MGNMEFRSALSSVEGGVILANYLHSFVDTMFAHVVEKNRKVLALNKHWGFVENKGAAQYPEECFVNGMKLVELFRTKEMYETSKQKWREYFPDISW